MKFVIIIAVLVVAGVVGGYFLYSSSTTVNIEPADQQSSLPGPKQQTNPHSKEFKDAFIPTFPGQKQ